MTCKALRIPDNEVVLTVRLPIHISSCITMGTQLVAIHRHIYMLQHWHRDPHYHTREHGTNWNLEKQVSKWRLREFYVYSEGDRLVYSSSHKPMTFLNTIHRTSGDR